MTTKAKANKNCFQRRRRNWYRACMQGKLHNLKKAEKGDHNTRTEPVFISRVRSVVAKFHRSHSTINLTNQNIWATNWGDLLMGAWWQTMAAQNPPPWQCHNNYDSELSRVDDDEMRTRDTDIARLKWSYRHDENACQTGFLDMAEAFLCWFVLDAQTFWLSGFEFCSEWWLILNRWSAVINRSFGYSFWFGDFVWNLKVFRG